VNIEHGCGLRADVRCVAMRSVAWRSDAVLGVAMRCDARRVIVF
jgi:hypothetical protein